MEPKLELVNINGKEYQLDIEQAKKLNLLTEKDNRVRSWEEFKEKYRIKIAYATSDILGLERLPGSISSTRTQLTQHEAKALEAFSKLLKLRRDWIGEWEPKWSNSENKYVIINWNNHLQIEYSQVLARPLSFSTKQMAEEFLKTFHDLIEEAKILI